MKHSESCLVLNSQITVGDLPNATKWAIEAAIEGRNSYVCIANVHMVVESMTNVMLKQAMDNADMVCSDGMPLVWELRRKGFKNAERVAGPDLMNQICAAAQGESIPVYFYGGSSSVVSLMQEKLPKIFKTLKVVGVESPPKLPIKPLIDAAVVERIKSSGAKILFIGLGCPKQELWMREYSPHIPCVMIGVGAAFDFLVGNVRRAPLWMQKTGLEWLYRLCSEPRRLWKRYLVTNSLFVWYWLLAYFRIKV